MAFLLFENHNEMTQKTSYETIWQILLLQTFYVKILTVGFYSSSTYRVFELAISASVPSS